MKRPARYVFSGWLVCDEYGARFTLVNREAYRSPYYVHGRACTNDLMGLRERGETLLLPVVGNGRAEPLVAGARFAEYLEVRLE